LFRSGLRSPALQDTVDERSQTIRLVDDHLRVLAQLRRRQLPLEQLRRAAQSAERILHLVRDLSDDAAGQALLREQDLLAAEAPGALGIDRLEQEPRLGIERLRTAGRAELTGARSRLGLAKAAGEAAVARAAAQRLELVRRVHDVGERTALRLPQADAGQAFGRRVHVRDREI